MAKVEVEFAYDSFFTVIFYKDTKVENRVTENQRKILDAMSKSPKITAKELSALIGIYERKIKENIRKLKDVHLLSRIGPAKGGYWDVAK